MRADIIDCVTADVRRPIRRRGTLLTYAELAESLAAGEYDWHLAVRLLRELVLRTQRLTDVVDIDEVHRRPPPTGTRGWDAILGGVAHITGRDRVSDPEILAWCFEPDRFCTDAMFDPFGVPPKYFWTDYLRTPVELQTRNVVLPVGNLEGV